MRIERIGDATLYQADYRDVELPSGIDAVLTDPPYGQTRCAWDRAPADMTAFWEKIGPLVKENAAVVVFGAGEFFVDVVNINRRWFRYDLVYEKSLAVGFLNANRQPLRAHELMAVFYRKLPEYHPQKFRGKPYTVRGGNDRAAIYNSMHGVDTINHDGLRYPRSVIRCRNTSGKSWHPTEKPLELMDWLTRAYTSEGQLVLDPFMGSGTTGVAALKAGRRFIGVEKDEHWFNVACRRMEACRG